MITEVYDAFRSAGADDEKARRAAEALSHYRDDITRLEHLISGVKTELKADISNIRTEFRTEIKAVKSELNVIRWILGIGFPTIFAMLIPMFWKIFSL